MNPLRIFNRLFSLETDAADAWLRINELAEKVRRLEAIDPLAIADERIKEHAAKSLPCGRCGGLMDVAVDREHGPRIVENGKLRAIVCAWCHAALKPRGWTLAKVELPAPPVEPTPEPTKEAEVPA
jgi:hypothetical protein